MRTSIRIFSILFLTAIAVCSAVYFLKPDTVTPKKQSTLDLENKLNAVIAAKKAGLRSQVAKQTPPFQDRFPASTGQTLERKRTSYLILDNYRALPSSSVKNAPAAPQARINGFAVYRSMQSNQASGSLVVKNQRTGRYGVFTKRLKIRYENERALEELRQDSRLQVDTTFDSISMALVLIKDPDFDGVKASLENRPGILSVDYEIIEHRPGVGK